MEILLIHPGGLGDIILSLPAMALLRTMFPAANLTLACNLDHVAAILGSHIERAVSLATLPLHNLYSNEPLPEADVRFWKSFDGVVSWTGAGDTGFVQKLRTVQPNARIASWKPRSDESRHVAQLFIDSIGFDSPQEKGPVQSMLRMSSEWKYSGQEWLKERGWDPTVPLAALHPGAGSRIKRWPAERFVQLIRHLTTTEKRKVLIIEGPAEAGIAWQIAGQAGDTVLIRAESLPLDLLAAVISQARLFVGNDSGISHLAAAVGVPSVVLFGPTLPAHWAPLGPNVTVLHDPQGCAACNAGGELHTCLENLTVEALIRLGVRPRQLSRNKDERVVFGGKIAP